ncbi:MAG: SDR family oxidoreductase [Candidatus Omnitrophica bacterium]|nr:SDR family oxidoreductase [Candidatus Omnitrophota bacterium]
MVKKIALVTGGAGFIGSHLVEYLLKNNFYVRVLDNFYTGKKENIESFVKKIELIHGDIRNKNICLMATKNVDYVFHQAALRSVPGSFRDPKDYNEVNIEGTLNMLEASLKNKVKCFVFASSSSIYGEAKKFPEKETDYPSLVSPYGLTKLTGEYYCRIFSLNYGLKTVCLRYFNVFGERQSLDDEYAIVIPKFINCLIRDLPPPIYGDGYQSRDFIYIENVVKANILAIKNINNYRPGDVFNIGSGKSYTILELVKFLNIILNKNIKPIFLEKRAGDVFKTQADISLAKTKLMYIPTVNFVTGLRRTVKYFKEKWQKEWR